MSNRLILLRYRWLYGRHTPQSALKAAHRFQAIAHEAQSTGTALHASAVAEDLADYARRLGA